MKSLVIGVALLAVCCLSGCTTYLGGQNLPSPHYLGDDVQYHAPGPEFKLAREAAQLKEFQAEQQLNQQ